MKSSTSLDLTPSTHLDLISQDALKEVCAASGPFITVYLPARHPGASDLSTSDRMRGVLREARIQLTQRRFLGPIDRLLKPLEDLAGDDQRQSGGGDSVIFASTGFYRHLALPAPVAERLVVASHPHVTPLLSNMLPAREFYVLAVSKKLLRLVCWRDGKCSETPLPAGASASFEKAASLETPDHDLQNYSAAGARGSSTRFGTGAEREDAHRRLQRYFHGVDRALASLLNGKPLVVVGIEQELAAYRSAAQYPNLLEAKHTSPAHLSLLELARHGENALRARQRSQAEEAFAVLRETSRRDHVVSGIREALEAAREGRVQRLFVERSAESLGMLGPVFPMDDSLVEGEQDLINAAAVETLRRDGEVLMLDQGQLSGTAVAALLRYSRPAQP